MPALKPRNPHRNAPEYADRVNLLKKIKIGKEWRFAPVVPEANGRLKDKVRVNGQVEVHIEGSYFIEWWVSGRRFREATTREDAIECARHKTVERRAIRAGLIASPEPPPVAPDKTPIGDAIDDYLKYVKMQRKPRTHLTYRYTLDTLLRASYKKKYVEDATRADVLDFLTYCYELGLGARTVYDKVVTVLQLFKKHGRSGLMEKGDWPKYVDAIRPIYEPEELIAMFNVATEDEADLLKFILGSGFRDQELRYVAYLDLDFRHHLARVTAKAKWGFTPKNWEERTVPLPAGLMERLRKRKERKQARPHDLVFGNTKGRPDSEMDMVVKRVAERAGQNCGQCVTEHNNKCAEGPYCMNFFLHKFRHTFATNHLRDGVDKGANLDLLIKKSGVPSWEIVVVGDSFSKDIMPAKLRGMSTIWVRRSFPRERSYWGTPELPIASSVYEPTRSAISGRAADLMILDIEHLTRALGLNPANGNMVLKNSGSSSEVPRKHRRRAR